MIPKLIHQTAKTVDLDERSRKYQAIVRAKHPDWTYRLWTDADNDAFVRAEYPDFYLVFAGYPKGILRADVIRYLLMDRLGGLYLDLDYEVLRPFDQLEHECVVPLESSGEWGEGRDLLGNCYFAATPGSVFFRRVIEALARQPKADAGVDVLSTTGPAFITSVYRGLPPDERTRVHTPLREQFHPKTPRNDSEYRAILAQSGVYGIHHCHGTWREYSLAQRVKMRAKGLIHRVRG